MPTKPVPVADNQALTRIKADTARDIQPILARAKELVIITPADYAKADATLGKVMEARKLVEFRFSEIIDPLLKAKREIEASRKAAVALVDEIDKPLEVAERNIREGMRQYKLEESRQAAALLQRKEAEEQKLREEAAEKQRREELARTAPMRERLRLQREALEAQADEVAAVPTVAPVKVLNSGTRTVKRWRVTNFKDFLEAALSGAVPVVTSDCDGKNVIITFANPGVGCPGIEQYDDIQIVRR